MFRLPLTDRTTALLRRLEEMALELVDQRGTSRTALARELGVAGNTLTANLDPDRPPEETTDPRWAFAVFEHFGRDPIQVLAGLCPADAPEELLSILPIPGLDPAEERRKRRTKAHKERVACLQAARRLDAWLPRESDEALARPWPERRFRDPDLEPVYHELEELEERRHRDAVAVEETCREALIRPLPDKPTLPEAIRRVGLLGIWGTVQRSKHRLELARDALSLSIAFARRLGDESLLAKQLQRSAYVFRDLGAQSTAVSLLREVSERFRIDQHQNGDAYSLIDRASMAGTRGEIEVAERLFLAGSKSLSASASPFYKLTVIQGIATCRDHRGDLEGALSFLGSTLTSSKEYDHPQVRAYILHTIANIERKMGRYFDAIESYRLALEHLHGQQDPEAELKLYLDLAVCWINAGEPERIKGIAVQVRNLLPKLRNQSYLQTQCELLIRELSSETVSVEALAEIRNRNLRSGGQGGHRTD